MQRQHANSSGIACDRLDPGREVIFFGTGTGLRGCTRAWEESAPALTSIYFAKDAHHVRTYIEKQWISNRKTLNRNLQKTRECMMKGGW